MLFSKMFFSYLGCHFGVDWQVKLRQSTPKKRSGFCKNPLASPFGQDVLADIDLLAFLHRFWRVLGTQLGAKLASLGSQGGFESLQHPIFGEHVSKMPVKRLQNAKRKCNSKRQIETPDFFRIFSGLAFMLKF